MSVRCRECGRSNQDGREFCFSCGAFLEWAGERVDSDIPLAMAPTVAVPPGEQAEPPRETLRRLAIDLSPARVSVTPGERESDSRDYR